MAEDVELAEDILSVVDGAIGRAIIADEEAQRRQRREMYAAVKAAIGQERERCAKIAEDYYDETGIAGEGSSDGPAIAKRIRSGQ